MARELPEWIAARDDQAIPPRVKVRVFDRCGGRCCICTLLIRGSLRPEYDHIVALINAGQHRESNLQILCSKCHSTKSRADVALKSKNYQVRAKHLGVEFARAKIHGGGFRKASPQRTASRPLRRKSEAQQPD